MNKSIYELFNINITDELKDLSLKKQIQAYDNLSIWAMKQKVNLNSILFDKEQEEQKKEDEIKEPIFKI